MSFRLVGENRVNYEIDNYDASKDLIIDPLIYSTFVGGSDDDYGYGIALDSGENAYITGSTTSNNFPTENEYEGYQGGYDVVIFKSLICPYPQ